MQCPSCHKEVTVKDKDFGALFTCPQCRSVYFLNFDGTPDFGEVNAPSPEELAKLQSLPDKKKSKKKNKKSDSDELDQHDVDAHLTPEQTAMAIVPGFPPATEMEIPAMEAPSVEMPTFETSPLEMPQATESQPFQTESFQMPQEEQTFAMPEPEPAPMQEESAQTFGDVMLEIENFGNQQTVVAGITYDLEITGLDTKEAQTLLKEAIEDSRFGWHAEDFVREIRSGTCHFKDLTPVQAFILARRIQFIDIEMRWTQNVIA